MSDELGRVLALMRALPAPGDCAEAIERIAALERLKSVIAAAQAEQTAAFVAMRRAEQVTAGVPARDVGAGVAAEVALARRISPHQAQRYVGWAGVLVRELPRTFAALRRGEISEWRAMIVARETIWLSAPHRAVVDAELASKVVGSGDRRLEAATKAIAYRLDPVGFTNRSKAAASDRRVSVRPAPDTMCRLTALLPVAQGVAAYAALARAADTHTATGDERGRGQLMADILVQRVTGQATAAAVPVEVELVMTDQTLLGGDEPARLVGHGPVPAPLARELALSAEAPGWLRRLFRAPGSSELAAMESRRRLFTPAQKQFLRLRDQGVCRTPYCDAPIRHADHVVPVEAGGTTSISNGQGLCAACNYAKQARRWHRCRHGPPEPPQAERSPFEKQVVDQLRVA